MRRAVELVEIMDDPAVGASELAVSLRFIRRVNRYLGGTSAVLGHLRRFSRRWKAGEAITVLDVATGSADIPEAIVAWAGGSGRNVKVVGLDRHEKTLEIAREWVRRPEISFVRGDALQLPLGDKTVDYATCSMFLHHLTEDEALRVVREMLRVSRRGIIINDLLRSRWAYAGIYALTIAADEIDRHDARVSVMKGWTKREVRAWGEKAGAPFLRYRRKLFGRFTLAGEW